MIPFQSSYTYPYGDAIHALEIAGTPIVLITSKGHRHFPASSHKSGCLEILQNRERESRCHAWIPSRRRVDLVPAAQVLVVPSVATARRKSFVHAHEVDFHPLRSPSRHYARNELVVILDALVHVSAHSSSDHVSKEHLSMRCRSLKVAEQRIHPGYHSRWGDFGIAIICTCAPMIVTDTAV
eukprot:COSAG02_NODE_358_length_23882_cov_25.508683_16_plen_182_part_00